jgi:hypothetical protein
MSCAVRARRTAARTAGDPTIEPLGNVDEDEQLIEVHHTCRKLSHATHKLCRAGCGRNRSVRTDLRVRD